MPRLTKETAKPHEWAYRQWLKGFGTIRGDNALVMRAAYSLRLLGRDVAVVIDRPALVVRNSRGTTTISVRTLQGQNLPFKDDLLMVKWDRRFKFTSDHAHPRTWHGTFISVTEVM